MYDKPRLRFPWLSVFILLFAGAFGMAHINADSINVDELLAFGDMGGFALSPYTPAQVVESLINHHPDHVPFWYILGAGIAQQVGWSQAALRTVSVLTCLLMFALLYRFSVELTDSRTALLALFLISTTSVILHYTYKIRMSTLLMLVGIVHCWTYWRLINRSTTHRRWFAFVVTGTALMYTHFFGVLLVIGMGLNHLCHIARSCRCWRIVFGWIVICALFLPYLPVMVQGFDYNLKNYSTATVTDVFIRISSDFVNGSLVLWIPLLLALINSLRKCPNKSVLTLLRIGIAGCGAYLLLKLALDDTLVTRTRYLYVLWFAIVVPLAYGLASLRRWILILFLIAWCGVLYERIRPDQSPCFNNDSCISRPTALRVLKDVQPKDLFVSAFDQSDNSNRTTLIRTHGYSAVDYYLRELGYNSVALQSRKSPSYYESKYKRLARNYARFLLGFNPTMMLHNFPHLQDLISTDYVACASLINEPTLQVTQYVDRSLGCEHRPAPITYDSQITVIDRFARYLPKEKRLQILTWIDTANRQQQLEYNVSWQIITPNWRNVRQIDKHLHDSSVLPWSRIEMSTDGIEPGDYRLMLILYRSDNGAKSAYRDPSSGQESGFLPVLEFTISPDSG